MGHLLELETSEAEGLFHLLDVDESGEVGIEEFIMGCMRLKGTAKSIDLATLLYENKRVHTVINKVEQNVRKNTSSIEQLMKTFMLCLGVTQAPADQQDACKEELAS